MKLKTRANNSTQNLPFQIQVSVGKGEFCCRRYKAEKTSYITTRLNCWNRFDWKFNYQLLLLPFLFFWLAWMEEFSIIFENTIWMSSAPLTTYQVSEWIREYLVTSLREVNIANKAAESKPSNRMSAFSVTQCEYSMTEWRPKNQSVKHRVAQTCAA